MDVPADPDIAYETLRSLPVPALRALIREGRYRGHTAGLAAGRLQANLAIVPEPYALDFMRFCQRNPKACPLVGVSDTGDPRLATLGDIDVRTDVPLYDVYRNGEPLAAPSDLHDVWTPDLVAFALGCSFTFEHALQAAGIRLQHIEHDRTVPMYRTSIRTVPSGPFHGGMVVSMRPVPAAEVERAIAISRRFPLAHGAPVHVGDPALIGIGSIDAPDWGDAPVLAAGDVPVFWACGVTSQNVLRQAKMPVCITHRPGHMLVTDVDEDAEVPVIAA